MSATGACCTDCGYANLDCVCVMRARLEGLAKELRRTSRKAARHQRLWQAAASCLAYNHDRLQAPRGADERRVIQHALRMTNPMALGGTDGIIPEPPEPQGALNLNAPESA